MDVTNASGTNSTLSNAQAQSLPGNLSDSVTSALGGNSPSASTVAPTNPDGSPVQQATPATPSSTLPAAGTSGGVGDILGDIYNSLGGASGLLNLGAFGATAAYGIDQAKKAQDDTTAKANELKQIGQPLLDESKTLLDQFKSGTLRPEQQQLVDFTTQQGQNLIDSGQALSAIAQQAYQDYQSGKLPQADEQKLNDQVAAQKQAVRQRLGSAGITDSTILAAQDQQIDNQAMQTRQSLLDARFATGNQAYDEWLKSTEAGQALKAQGYQFASTAFEQMLNDSLSFSTAGMEPISQAISLEIQSDKDLADSVNQLLGNLAAAYAYTVGGGAAGSGSNPLSGLLGGFEDLLKKYFKGSSSSTPNTPGTPGTPDGLSQGDVNQVSQGTDQAVGNQLGNTPPISLPNPNIGGGAAAPAGSVSIDPGSVAEVPGSMDMTPGAISGGVASGAGVLGDVPGISAGDTFAGFSPGAASSIDAAAGGGGGAAAAGGGAAAGGAVAGASGLSDVAGISAGDTFASFSPSAASSLGGSGAGTIGGLSAGTASIPLAIIAADAAGLYGADQKANSIKRAATNQQARFSLGQYLAQRDQLAALEKSGKQSATPETSANLNSYFKLPTDITAEKFNNLSPDEQQKYADAWAQATGNSYMMGKVDGEQFLSGDGPGLQLTQLMKDYNQKQFAQDSFQTPELGSPEYLALLQSVMGPG